MACSKLCDKKYSRTTNLQKSECEKRECVVSHVSYLAELTLPKDEHYYGHMTLRFDLKKDQLEKKGEKALKVDFHGLEIHDLVINGVKTMEVEFNDHGIFLPLDKLFENGNTVVIAYKNEYGSTGSGLHSYTDPADGEQYVYTFFEAHYAHEVFPMFDQPNLKASCSLILNATDSWTMISNEEAREVTTYKSKEEWAKSLPHSLLAEGSFKDQAIKRWEFMATPKLSTYLYAFCGGNYDVIEGPPGLVCPMKLYYRKSVKQYITDEYAAEWFKASDHSTRFYESYMNVAYPYSKMDHIIVPEFNMGAMEQVGCITYTEKYLFKVPPSRSRRINVTNTIMHEIAHQWFGNLITMHWWDDLWLNEAFATFMSSVAQESYVDTHGVHTGQEAWLYLVNDTVWGLKEDQGKETHPIACTAKDTVEAENIFDGISYGKGSSFLKTWCHYVGPDRFRQGVRDYFSRYMQSNASLCHFVRTQDEAADLEVTDWAHSWLKTQGAMEVSMTCDIDESSKTIKNAKILQTFCPNADEVYKRHKMDIALFYKDGKHLRKEVKTVLVNAEASTALPEFDGVEAPDAFLVNAENHVYCKAVNDVRSTEFLLQNYHEMEDILDRYCFIVALVYQIRDAKYPALKYLASFESSLINEPIAFLKEAYIKHAAEFIELVSEDHYDKYVEKLYHVIKNDLIKQVEGAKGKGVEPKYADCATTLVAYLLMLVSRSTSVLETEGLAMIKTKHIGPYPLDDSQIRGILPDVVSLESLSGDDRTKLIEDTLGPMGNNSDVQSCRRSCEAAIPDLNSKKKIFDLLINPPKSQSQEAYGDYASYFCTRRQPKLMEPFSQLFYDNVLKIHQNHIHFLSEKFLHYCVPSNVYREDGSICQKLEDIAKDADKMFKTNVAAVCDRDTRRINARKLTDPAHW